MSRECFPLDLLAQQPRINRLYTHLTLCYALRVEERAATTQLLTNACNTLSKLVPWSAGEVVYDGTSFQIQCSGDDVRLALKEVKEPTFEGLQTAQFPFSMIHESDYAPCKTVATDDAKAAALPVFMIQATYVQGGLLLTFAGQHGAMDVVGLGQLMYLFSKVCRDEALTESELDVANAKRWTGLPGKDANSPLHGQSREGDMAHVSEFSSRHAPRFARRGGISPNRKSDSNPHQLDAGMSESRKEDSTSSSPHELSWAYLVFSESSLNVLKSRANEGLEGKTFVSTDDALTAFIWLSITRMRAQTFPHRTSLSTTLSRQVDMRRYLSLAPTYPGLMVQDTRHTLTVNSLLHQSIGSVAIQLRSALDSSSLTRRFYEQVQSLRASGAQSKSHDVPPLEVRLSSWSKVSCYELDLSFDKPLCVRRPAFADGARDGLVYFLPKAPDSSIAVALCLEAVDMEALKKDAELAKFASYIG